MEEMKTTNRALPDALVNALEVFTAYDRAVVNPKKKLRMVRCASLLPINKDVSAAVTNNTVVDIVQQLDVFLRLGRGDTPPAVVQVQALCELFGVASPCRRVNNGASSDRVVAGALFASEADFYAAVCKAAGVRESAPANAVAALEAWIDHSMRVLAALAVAHGCSTVLLGMPWKKGTFKAVFEGVFEGNNAYCVDAQRTTDALLRRAVWSPAHGKQYLVFDPATDPFPAATSIMLLHRFGEKVLESAESANAKLYLLSLAPTASLPEVAAGWLATHAREKLDALKSDLGDDAHTALCAAANICAKQYKNTIDANAPVTQ